MRRVYWDVFWYVFFWRGRHLRKGRYWAFDLLNFLNSQIRVGLGLLKYLLDENLCQKAEVFREEIFEPYGFTEEARRFIRSVSRIVVIDFASTKGGGFWFPPPERLVFLDTAQHHAALHELSHVWWHWARMGDLGHKEGLVRDLVRLSDLDLKAHPQFARAISFAREYVHGTHESDWPGMLANAETGEKVSDAHNLTPEDFEKRIIDWEIFAGLCSYTMGQYKSGPRALPPFMGRHFETLFTGELKIKPYYEVGGHP